MLNWNTQLHPLVGDFPPGVFQHYTTSLASPPTSFEMFCWYKMYKMHFKMVLIGFILFLYYFNEVCKSQDYVFITFCSIESKF